MLRRPSLFVALSAACSSAALAQLAPDNPACRRDAELGVLCAHNPPAAVPLDHALELSVLGVAGSSTGFQAGARYDLELRGSGHLVHADLLFGQLSREGSTMGIAHAEVTATLSSLAPYRYVAGIRHFSAYEISHPLTVFAGVRFGRAMRYVTTTAETGIITNRQSGKSGLEATLALTGYQSLALFEIDGALRAGTGATAGGLYSGATLGLTRRVGAQAQLRGEWLYQRLTRRDNSPSASVNQMRLIGSVGVGLLRSRSPVPKRRTAAGDIAGDSSLAMPATDEFVSADARAEHLARARVHIDTAVSAKDVFQGPAGNGAYVFREEVACRHEPDAPPTGNSPKFFCRDEDQRELKVKYGCKNGEVFAEVAATRLLWLLGFEADRMYPVVVTCPDCPPMPAATVQENLTHRFDCAVIERKSGDPIESFPDEGWSWAELDRVSPAAGGASRAERDALVLVAVLLQHNDNKVANQRMDCPRNAWSPGPGGVKTCTSPTLLIQDVGATFGGAGNRVREDSKVDLVHWREQRIWRDGASCTANLAGSTKNGTLIDPRISEEGRAFLARLVERIRPVQIHDLFRVSQVTLRDPGTSLEDWESAFWYKAYQIINHRCP